MSTTWEAVHKQTDLVPYRWLWPGAAGIALRFNPNDVIPISHDRAFLPPDALSWTTMTAVPPQKYLGHEKWETRLCWVGVVRLINGVPHVRAADAESTWDARQRPFGRRKGVEAGSWRAPQVLHEDRQEDLRVTLALGQALNAFGFVTKDEWRKVSEKKEGFRFVYGGRSHKRLDLPESWSPTPLIGVPVDDPQELLRLECEVEEFHPRWYKQMPPGMMVAFLRYAEAGMPLKSPVDGVVVGVSQTTGDPWVAKNLQAICVNVNGGDQEMAILVHRDGSIHAEPGQSVSIGTELGFAGPEFQKASKEWSWQAMERLAELLGARRTLFEVTRWLHNQLLIIGGQPCLPFELIERWATANSTNTELIGWEFDPNQWDRLYDPAADAIIPPPLPLRWWGDHRKPLPGGTRLVLLDEADPRLVTTTTRRGYAGSQ